MTEMSKTAQIEELRREVENLKGQVAVLLQIVRPSYYPPYPRTWSSGGQLTTHRGSTSSGATTRSVGECTHNWKCEVHDGYAKCP